MLRRTIVVIVTAAALLGCDMTGGPTAPPATSTPAPGTPTATPTLTPTITLTPTQTLTPTALPTLRPDALLDLGSEIPADQQAQIRDAVALGYACLQTSFGESVPIALYARFKTEDIARIYSQKTGTPLSQSWPDNVAQSEGRNIFLRTADNWTITSPAQRMVIIMHEMFHTQQAEWGGKDYTTSGTLTPRSGPIWLIEGIAQLFGERCAAEFGLKVWDETFNKYQVIAAGSKLKLTDMVTPVDWLDHGSYITALLGADSLYRQHGWEGFRSYFKAVGIGTPWPKAFEDSFGITADDFYIRFGLESANALATSSPLTITLIQVYPAGTTPGAENPNLIGYRFRISGIESLGSAYTLTTDRITLPPHSQLVSNTNEEILIAMRTDTPAGTYHLIIDLPDGRKADVTFEHKP